jgi:metal-responsive CopG/Arc/MetJ family transcriptional regulator
MKLRKTMKRGAVRASQCVFVGAWLPIPLVNSLDEAVTQLDSDRSKIIRDALREKVSKEAAS